MRIKLHHLPLSVLVAGTLLACAGMTESQAIPPTSSEPEHRESTLEEISAMDSPHWDEIDRLIIEDKLEAASKQVADIRERARLENDETQLTRALIIEVQLRIALHGYETAVRFLAEEEWPRDPRLETAVELFFARALVTYLSEYSWEIAQRERTAGVGESPGEIDLESMTGAEIAESAHRAFANVWSRRETWGDESLGTLATFFVQNDYPARIRGTLRDAITYLWVELLADTSMWSPRDSTSLHRLDVRDLLSSGANGATGMDLTAPALHPLERLAGALTDLEGWHLDNGRPEAAFEARRQLVERLDGALTIESDKELLRASLDHHLDRLGNHYEWWSAGMATRAELERQRTDSEALVRTKQLAEAGALRHPESVGGRRCKHLAEAIEAPHFSLSAMTTDGLDRRSIAIAHRNLARLHFRAFRLDLRQQVLGGRDHNILPAYQEVPKLIATRQAEAQWTVELPATPDFREHRTYVTPPIDETGLWVIVGSAREDFADKGNRLASVNLVVTDLVLIRRQVGRELEVTVRSGASGDSLEQIKIQLYRYDWQRGHHLVSSHTTGKDGIARFSIGENRYPHFLMAETLSGTDIALDSSHLYGQRTVEPSERTASLVYTDRSVYRPNQDVLWKVVAYRGGAPTHEFQTLAGNEMTVELVDPNAQVVASAKVVTNDFGSASGSFEIPSGRLLGHWHLRTSSSGFSGILVEEYKRPTFEVVLEDPPTQLRLNTPAKLTGNARYYFGLPVTAGEVSWQVSREPVYPYWWFWFRHPEPRAGTQMVAAGTAELDNEGRFELAFVPDADERLDRGVSYRYRLSADVTADAGETRSASRSFRLGFVAVEARIEAPKRFFVADDEINLSVRRVDLDGVGREGRGEWRLVRLDQPQTALLPADQPILAAAEDGYRTAGDLLRPRWETSLSPLSVMRSWPDSSQILESGPVEHDGDGHGLVSIGPLSAGAYRLRYATKDAFEASFETSFELVVVEPKAKNLALPTVLLVEKEILEVGDTARVLVHSGLENQQQLLEVARDGRPVARHVLSSADGIQVIEIPVREADRGGFSLTLTALRDHQLMISNARVSVPWTDRRLDLAFTTFRDRIRPGATESWKISVSTADGSELETETAELLAYMYDRSLDLFAAHTPPTTLGLYPDRTGTITPQGTLGSTGESWRHEHGFVPRSEYPSLSGDQLKMLGGYSIGGLGARRLRKSMRFQEMAMSEAVPASPSPLVASAEATAESAADELVAEGSGGGDTLEAPTESLRTNFSETGFWKPHLILEPDGSASIEVEVPDSVTEWSVWVHALTTDLRGGALESLTRSVKELMVRPYVPRFLREGDRATLRVAVDNTGEELLEGAVELDLVDPETRRSLADEFDLDRSSAPFSLEAGSSTTVEFSIVTPSRLGTVAFQATATAAGRSDGEVRPVPILPGRLHLMQSRFAALHDRDRRILRFDELAANDDPTRIDDQLIVTLDGQLFFSVLQALPYLVEYPYECTEQTLNRFVSTGVVSSVFEQHPALATMAAELADRETRFESWNATDPNRAMALEESPWLRTARGGEDDESLIRLLDPTIARAHRDASLADLANAQTSLGAFPWWPGGPPSPYMTLYILQGLSKALEFDIEVPRDLVVRAWQYLHRHYIDTLVREALDKDCCWEMVTFLNYVLSSYPDEESWTGGVFSADERTRMLDFSFAHRNRHSPLLKAQLALTLERSGRHADAVSLFDSIMDSARTEPDLGTYWAAEDRSWLWYNDTVEGHSLALRALTELAPDDPRRHGLVQWLLLDKKLNHWKSTRATAEAIYALVHYLQREGALGAREEVDVRVGSRSASFVFEPDQYTGKNRQLVLIGEEIGPEAAEIVVEKETPGFLFASATWHFSTEELPEASSSDFFAVERTYFRRIRNGTEWVLQPLADGTRLEIGDQLEVQISIRTRHAAEYVHLRDPRGAGFEPESLTSGHRWNLGISWYEEVRDSGTNFFFEWLPAGEHTFKYRVRANTTGEFRVGPATIQSMYAPEFTAYSSGEMLVVDD